MAQSLNNMLEKFLSNEFPVKRVKNNLGKWSRVMIITGGYIRNTKKIYNYNKNLDRNLIAADLTLVLVYVFACRKSEALNAVLEHIDG